MRLAFSGDTLPNKWWIENTQGVDFSIHECFSPPNLAKSKWGFTQKEALNAVTTIHSTAAFFGKMMAPGGERYNTPDSVLAGWPEDVNTLVEEIYKDFNEEHGTDYKFQLK